MPVLAIPGHAKETKVREMTTELTEILITATNAIFPVMFLILLGYVLRQAGFLNENFVQIGAKLGFYVCIPCMQFLNVYNLGGFADIRWDVVIYACVIVLVLFGLGTVSALLSTKVPERRGVIVQCAFRSNVAVIGLALAGTLGGPEAAAVTSIVSAMTLPLKNALAVVALSVFVGDKGGERRSLRRILTGIARNPLIIGILLGMVCLSIRAIQISVCGRVVFALKDQMKFLYTAINDLKSMTTPLTLIAMGGQFRFANARGRLREIAVGTLWRIVFSPLVGIGIAVLLTTRGWIVDFGVEVFPALIAFFSTPAPVSGATMAGQMGNDEDLATQLVVWTNMGSIVTMFLTACILMATGFIAT